MRVLMVQGTASHVGKSLLVAALCRIFRQDGFKVAPFKAQNMSLNSYVTPDGGEIGRAQVVQAEAAGLEPTVEMNPILLKPESDSHCQVVLLGRPFLSVAAKDYYQLKSQLWATVTEALDNLRSQYEIVVIEGAGSPAEINLKEDEIVNMRVAHYSGAPVLLVGDIDRGGVFASLLGTLWLLTPKERATVKALIINKFRGDISLLEPGLTFLENKAGIPVAGVVPYFHDIYIPQEDSVSLEQHQPIRMDASIDIAVIRLPHTSNFDDFDPLEQEKDIVLRYVNTAEELKVPDLVIIPGSKTTMADLDWLVERGLANKIAQLYQQGVFIIGICGGYQMLGRYILDPQHMESSVTRKRGMGLLPVSTVFSPSKYTHRVRGVVKSGHGLLSEACGLPFQGYEIHMGRTEGQDDKAPFQVQERSGQPYQLWDGCMDDSGRVLGTYIHGLFHNRELRRVMLEHIATSIGKSLDFLGADLQREDQYDKLAELVRHSLNMDLIYDITGL